MYHLVTFKLAMTGSATPVLEFSRAVALQDFNAAGFELWVLSADDVIDDADFILQGSNDLSNWADIGGTTTTDAPTHLVWPPSGKLPWEYVRLKYSLVSSANAHVMFRAAISLSNIG